MPFSRLTHTHGVHVRLTPAGPEHADLVFGAWETDGVRDSWRHAKPSDAAEERAYLKKNAESPSDHLFLIERLSDNAVIGTIGLHQHDAHNATARLGLVVFRRSRDERLLSEEAIELLLDLAFDPKQLDLRSVYFHLREGDGETDRVMRKLGFVDSGFSRVHVSRNGAKHRVRMLDCVNPILKNC